MISKFGNVEFNLPFHFATKRFPLSKQEEGARRTIVTEKMLKLLGFLDESVNGWEIIHIYTCNTQVKIVYRYINAVL